MLNSIPLLEKFRKVIETNYHTKYELKYEISKTWNAA